MGIEAVRVVKERRENWEALCAGTECSAKEAFAGKLCLQQLIKNTLAFNERESFQSASFQLAGASIHLLSFVKKDGELVICRWSGEKYLAGGAPAFLGVGSHSYVQEIIQFKTKTVFALKVAKANPKSSGQSLQKEAIALERVHQLSSNLKIMPPLIAHGGWRSNENRQLCIASVAHKATVDGTAFFRASKISFHRKALLKQLLALLKTIEELREHCIFFTDIKAENVLVLDRSFRLGDMESLSFLGGPFMPPFEEAVGAFEKSYMTGDDYQRLAEAYNAGRDVFLKQMETRELFSFGLLVCELFSRGKKPYPMDGEGFLYFDEWDGEYYQALEDILGEGLAGWLCNCLSEDQDQRPTLADALEEFERLVSERLERDELCLRP